MPSYSVWLIEANVASVRSDSRYLVSLDAVGNTAESVARTRVISLRLVLQSMFN